MRGTRYPFGLWELPLVLGYALLPRTVLASGFQLVEQNASGLGNAYAGQAAGVRNATAIYFNPAALARTEGWSISASFEAIGVGTTFANSGSTVPQAGALAFPYRSAARQPRLHEAVRQGFWPLPGREMRVVVFPPLPWLALFVQARLELPHAAEQLG